MGTSSPNRAPAANIEHVAPAADDKLLDLRARAAHINRAGGVEAKLDALKMRLERRGVPHIAGPDIRLGDIREDCRAIARRA